MRKGDQFQTTFCFLEKALNEEKASGLQLSFNIFRQPSTWHIMKTNCIKRQTIDLEICSILRFQKKAQEQFFHHILCMIFQELTHIYCKNSTPAGIYLLKVNNRNTGARCEICSKLIIKIPGKDFLVSLLLILNIFNTLFQCFYCKI